MKYIRTPDGRILEWEKLNGVTRCVIDTCEDEIMEANTIEQLCDVFVFEMGLEHNICQLTYEHARDNILTCGLYSMSTLYGAVWTDKGLRYVAKMNEKGDLLLL